MLVCVRRTPLGVLVTSHAPAVGGEPTLTALLDATATTGARVICDIRNDPADSDFDAPVEATAGLLVELLAGREGDELLVASTDWFAIERARGAGLATAFRSGAGVKVGGALAYATAAGHQALIADAGVIGPGDAAKAREAGVELISWGRADVDVDGVVLI